MQTTDIEGRPTNVEPTETKTRRTRADKGQPRAKLTPGQIRAQAEDRARQIEARVLGRVTAAVESAAEAIGGERGDALRSWLEEMPK